MADGFPVALPPTMSLPVMAQENVNEAPPPNYPSEYYSGSKDDALAGGPRGATVLIAVIIVLGIIVMSAMVITLASGSRSNDQTTWRDEEPEIAKDKKGANALTVFVPEFRFPSTAPPLTTRSTTQANTEEKITEENTEKDSETPFTEEITGVRTRPKSTTTELPTTRAKKDTWAGLICTIGTKLSGPEVLPDDRFCNYLFYDSVYKKGPTPFDPNNLDPALSIFLGRLSDYKATALGIGFAYRYVQQLKSELSTKDSAAPLVLKHFFDKSICHFGILDTPSDGLDKSTLREMLESLELVDGFVRKKGAWPRKCHTVVAVPTPDPNLETMYIDLFPKIFTPSVVVILSHYVEGDNTFQDCRVVPPTMLTRPDSLTTNSNYKFDLNSAAGSIEKMIARGMDATWAISVTMKGRLTKLKAGQPVDFLSECEHDPSAESFGRFTEACLDPSFTYETHSQSGVEGALYYNKLDGRILSFDNNTNVVKKLCRLRALHLSFAYGIAAYDVDYDDYNAVCHSVSVFKQFTMVFTLTLVRDYVRTVFNDPAEYQDCLEQADAS